MTREVATPRRAGRSASIGEDFYRLPDSTGAMPYRTDIDGLRALAIGLVVVYHVWLGRVSGGVDVFLMISAFFLTASFARRLGARDGIRAGRYWARKFRRLLPAASVTILATLAVVALVYPATTWTAIWRQAWGSLAYVQNWVLSADAVDYYARDAEIPSPLQHFWSLSVQGQVFILWPLVFVLAAFIARRVRVNPITVLIGMFGTIFAVSLVYSIVQTQTSQTSAYFDTGARLWEFAAGSLVALLLPSVRLSRLPRVVLGWLGVVGIVVCGIVLDVQGGFPGYLALWPVLCTVAVVVAGSEPARGGPGRMLSSAPMRALGRDAYALYLVHWPILITWLVVTESTSVDVMGGVGVIVLSLVVARLISFLVERPLRAPVFDRRRVAPWVIVCSVLVVAVPLTAWQVTERVEAAVDDAMPADRYPGAAALSGATVLADTPVYPDATAIDGEWVRFDDECADVPAELSAALTGSCVESRYGSRSAPLVVIAGDSHAQQWSGVVLPIAETEGWSVVALLKAGCALALDESPVSGVADCPQWREAALAYIQELQPLAVFGMATKTVPDDPGEHELGGLAGTVDVLRASDAHVVLFRDNPRFEEDMFECIVAEPDDIASCTRERRDVLADRNPADGYYGSGVEIIDFSDYFCPDDVCEPVIGNVSVYLDDDHLTRRYAETLAPMLRAELVKAGVLAGASG